MFGFGMSAIDRVILAKTEQMCAGMGLSGDALTVTARRLFDETKAETKARHGDLLYLENFGEKFVNNAPFMASRKAV